MSSSVTHHSLQVPRTARYVTLGAPSRASTWWVVLHGYGQLAENFIENFAPLAANDVCVVAPEGLSRFYVDELTSHEEVGASWMTRVDRENEIQDYVAYLDTVVEDLGSRPSTLNVLGFSQGAATASRWTAFGEPRVNRLVLWGGGVPPDLDLAAHSETLEGLDITIVLGTKDPYLSPDDLEALEHRLESHGLGADTATFDGGHHLDPVVLERMLHE